MLPAGVFRFVTQHLGAVLTFWHACCVVTAALAALTLVTAPPCTTKAARTAIAADRVVVPASQSISSEPYRLDPSGVDGVICLPLPGGRTAMAAGIDSGGTAGAIGWVVFVGGPGRYELALVRGGYKLGLARVGSTFVETDPVYKKRDPNCCPSGGFDHTSWRWNGHKFVVARRWHNQSYNA
jgi:hypothetical protein